MIKKLLTLGIVFVPVVALAQLATGTGPAPEDPGALAQQIWTMLVAKNYAAALGPVLTLIVWALRKYDLKIPKYGPAIDGFLNQPVVAFLLPTVISGLGGFATALAAHQPFTDALFAVLQASGSAIVTYIGLNKVAEQIAAGKVAADTVQTKQDAIRELKKEDGGAAPPKA
jgi:hypothetical protein